MSLIIIFLCLFLFVAVIDNVLRTKNSVMYAKFLDGFQPNTGDWLPAVVFFIAMVVIFCWFRMGGI